MNSPECPLFATFCEQEDGDVRLSTPYLSCSLHEVGESYPKKTGQIEAIVNVYMGIGNQQGDRYIAPGFHDLPVLSGRLEMKPMGNLTYRAPRPSMTIFTVWKRIMRSSFNDMFLM